jgi:hypothetical protein
MNSLDLALNEYIAIRRALGFELREVAGCLRNFVAFLRIKAPPTSRGSWRSAGRPNPRTLSPTRGPGVWVWSGVSPRGTVRRNREQRSRRPAFFLIGINERRLTSIATKR